MNISFILKYFSKSFFNLFLHLLFFRIGIYISFLFECLRHGIIARYHLTTYWWWITIIVMIIIIVILSYYFWITFTFFCDSIIFIFRTFFWQVIKLLTKNFTDIRFFKWILTLQLLYRFSHFKAISCIMNLVDFFLLYFQLT